MHSQDASLPVAFELIQKAVLTTDVKSEKDKWIAPQTKNELARQMITSAQHKQVPFGSVSQSPLGGRVFLKAKHSKLAIST